MWIIIDDGIVNMEWVEAVSIVPSEGKFDLLAHGALANYKIVTYEKKEDVTKALIELHTTLRLHEELKAIGKK